MPDPATWTPNATGATAPVEPRSAARAQDEAAAADLARRQQEQREAQADLDRQRRERDLAAQNNPGGVCTPDDPQAQAIQQAETRVRNADAAVAESQSAQQRVEYRNAAARDAAAATQDATRGQNAFNAAVAAPQKQRYQIAVPHSGTQLTFGASSSRGGAGASLVTQGSVLVDSCGPADIQSAGAMALQTSSTLSAICNSNGLFGSVASITVSAGAQIKVYSGSPVAPGACGTGAPGRVATADMPPPAGGADQAVARRQVLNTLAKTAVDTVGLVRGARADGIMNLDAARGAVDVVGDLASLGQDVQSATGYQNDGLAKVLGKVSTATDGLAAAGAYNPVGAVNAVSDLTAGGGGGGGTGSEAGSGGSAGSAAAGGGGGTKIDMQAPENIEMRSMASITGTAVSNVEYKAGNKVSLKAGSVVEGTAMQVAFFGTVKSEMKSAVLVDLFAGVRIQMASPTWNATIGKFSFTAVSTGTIKTGGAFKVQTPATVTVIATAGTTITSSGRVLVKSGANVDIRGPKVNIISPETKATGKVTVNKKLTCNDDVKMDKNLNVAKQVQADKGRIKSSLTVLGSLKAG